MRESVRRRPMRLFLVGKCWIRFGGKGEGEGPGEVGGRERGAEVMELAEGLCRLGEVELVKVTLTVNNSPAKKEDWDGEMVTIMIMTVIQLPFQVISNLVIYSTLQLSFVPFQVHVGRVSDSARTRSITRFISFSLLTAGIP